MRPLGQRRWKYRDCPCCGTPFVKGGRSRVKLEGRREIERNLDRHPKTTRQRERDRTADEVDHGTDEASA
jgi:hypothetical protein